MGPGEERIVIRYLQSTRMGLWVRIGNWAQLRLTASLGLARVSADWELRAITNHSLGLGLIRTYPLDEANACWYGPPRMRMAGAV
jgi:hypothetical protein